MRQIYFMIAATFLLTGCSAGMVIAKRDTSETGRGTFESLGKTVSISIGTKNCSGHYATVRDRSEVGLINAYGQRTSAGVLASGTITGTVQSSSTTGYAKGLLTCTDGDLLRCEVKHDGPSGYGVCVGRDGSIYDLITGASL